MLCVLSGCSFFLSGRGSSERHTIKVLDESGKPLASAEVYAIETWVTTNWMGMGSTRQRVHGPLRTNSHGTVRVKIGHTSRVSYLATYQGWPSQTTTLASPKLIVLGPPRDLSGEIVLPAGCPPGVLSVAASKHQQINHASSGPHVVKPVVAEIDADLRFLARLDRRDVRLATRQTGSSVKFR